MNYIDIDWIKPLSIGSKVISSGGGGDTKNFEEILVKLLKNEHLNKGVEVETYDDGIVIDLFVIIQFGTKISVVAENIINQVKFNVEKQTGLEVKKVNLNIEGVKTK